MKSVDFELENGIATFDVTHFLAAKDARGWDPPEPGELELDDMGTFTSEDGTKSGFAYDDLVEAMAAMHGVGHESARELINEHAYQSVIDQYADDFDDHD